MGAVLKLVPYEPEFDGGDGDGTAELVCPECENDTFYVYPGPYGECVECGQEVSFAEGDNAP